MSKVTRYRIKRQEGNYLFSDSALDYDWPDDVKSGMCELSSGKHNQPINTGRSAREIAAELQEKYDKKKLKSSYVLNRRKAFHRSKKDLFISLIKSGAAYECASCQSKEYLGIDHIEPLSRGGSDALSNLQFLCRPCNSSKGTK